MEGVNLKGWTLNLEISQNYSLRVVAVLKELRLQKGLSQNILAERAGLSRAAIQHIEKGIRNPTLMLCHAVATAMGVSLASVLQKVEELELNNE